MEPSTNAPYRKRVLVLTGGKSAEHEVSMSGAKYLIELFKEMKVDFRLIVITTEGLWLNEKESNDAVVRGHARNGGEKPLECMAIFRDIDVVFPLIHATTGEDGTVQGLLEMLRIPYVGSGVGASAACLDKTMNKAVLAANGLPVLDGCAVFKVDLENDIEKTATKVAEKVKAPWLVKPASLGSSIGVHVALDMDQLKEGMHKASEHDNKLLVEQYLANPWECNVGVLGESHDPQISMCGRVDYGSKGIFDYDKKYTDGKKTHHIPADIPENVAKACQDYAVQAYKALGCSGLARVDFLCDRVSQKCYIMEMQTWPGFTALSVFLKLWKASGLTPSVVVERLLSSAKIK